MRTLPGSVRLAAQLSWHQWRQRIDLLHVQYRLPFVSLGACACTIHDVLFETHPQFFPKSFALMSRMASRAAINHADLLFTVSRYTRHAMADVYRIDPATIAVTYNAVDGERFHPYPAANELCARYGLVPNGYVCTVGRLEPRKNHLTLIRAYAELPAGLRGYPLVIIGQRDFDFDAIHELARSAGLEQSIRFIENASDDELPVLLSQASLFVYPSWAEGFGMPVLEAMACGVPVITSTTTSMPEVAGDAAQLVDPGDARALAQAIEADLTMSPGERSRRIASGLRQAGRFDWQRSARVLVDHFRQHLTGGLAMR